MQQGGRQVDDGGSYVPLFGDALGVQGMGAAGASNW